MRPKIKNSAIRKGNWISLCYLERIDARVKKVDKIKVLWLFSVISCAPQIDALFNFWKRGFIFNVRQVAEYMDVIKAFWKTVIFWKSIFSFLFRLKLKQKSLSFWFIQLLLRYQSWQVVGFMVHLLVKYRLKKGCSSWIS